MFKASEQVILPNGDPCRIGNYVIARLPDGIGETVVGRIEEILTIKGSMNDDALKADMVLLRKAIVTRASEKYQMPHIDLELEWSIFAPSVCCAPRFPHAT